MKAKIETKKIIFIECENCETPRSHWITEAFTKSEKKEKKVFSWTCPQCRQNWQGEIQTDGTIDIFAGENVDTEVVLIEVPKSVFFAGVVFSRPETDREMRKRTIGNREKRYRINESYPLEAVERDQPENPTPYLRYRAKGFKEKS